MGIIIAKFRKKQSTYEILTKLENDIVSIEEFQQRTQQTQRKIVYRFLILAFFIYIGLAVSLYFYFPEFSQKQKLLWFIPLITFPFIIYLLRILIRWYYNRKIVKNEKKLVSLKEKKKKILENVMETETYKVAKKILDKFQNEPKKLPVIATPRPATPFSETVRQRITSAQSQLKGRESFGLPETPSSSIQNRMLTLKTPATQRLTQVPTSNRQLALGPAFSGGPATPALPRSILPSNRSTLDKMVDYLVGDGPSNRYALICRQCHNHNGMSLKEEFEYFSFNCAYCGTHNPARKKRLKISTSNSPLAIMSKKVESSESSDSERNSDGNDSDSPIVEEPRGDSPDTAKTSDYEKVSESELAPEDLKMDVDASPEQNREEKSANMEKGDGPKSSNPLED